MLTKIDHDSCKNKAKTQVQDKKTTTEPKIKPKVESVGSVVVLTAETCQSKNFLGKAKLLEIVYLKDFEQVLRGNDGHVV